MTTEEKTCVKPKEEPDRPQMATNDEMGRESTNDHHKESKDFDESPKGMVTENQPSDDSEKDSLDVLVKRLQKKPSTSETQLGPEQRRAHVEPSISLRGVLSEFLPVTIAIVTIALFVMFSLRPPNGFGSITDSWETVDTGGDYRLQKIIKNNGFTDLYAMVKSTQHPVDIGPYIAEALKELTTDEKTSKLFGENPAILVPWEDLDKASTRTIITKMLKSYYTINYLQSHGKTGEFANIKIDTKPLCFTDLKWSPITIRRDILRDKYRKLVRTNRDSPLGRELMYGEEHRSFTLNESPSTPSDPSHSKCGPHADSPGCFNNPSSTFAVPVQMVPYMPLLVLDSNVIYHSRPDNNSPNLWVQTPQLVYITRAPYNCVYDEKAGSRPQPIEYEKYRKDLRVFLKLTELKETITTAHRNQKQPPMSEEASPEEAFDATNQKRYHSLSLYITSTRCNMEGIVVNYDGESVKTRVEFVMGGQPLQKFTRCLVDDPQKITQWLTERPHSFIGLELNYGD